MAKILIEKLMGGFASDYQYNNTFAVEARSDQYTNSNGVSLLRNGRMGEMAPAELFTTNYGDGSTNINSYPRSMTPDVTTSGKTYTITGGLSGTAPRLVEFESAVNANSPISLASTASHGGHNFTTMPSTSFWGEDTAIYSYQQAGTPVRALFYSWQDNTDGDIGRLTINSTLGSIGTADDDYISTTATGGSTSGVVTGVPHKFAEGADLILYMTNGQYICSIDGTGSGVPTVNYQALNIGAGWTAVSIRSYKNYIAVACVKSSTNGVFNYESINKVLLWDGYSPDPNFVYEIQDSRIGAIFVAEGNLYAWTAGKNNTTKLWIFDGSSFKKVTEALTSVIGNPPSHEKIDYYRGGLVWASGSLSNTPDKQVIYYGQLNSRSKGIHIIAQNSNGTNTSGISVLKNLQQSSLTVAGLYDTTYAFQGSASDSYLISSKLRTRLFVLPHRSMIKKFTVYFSQFGTGASVTLSLFKGKVSDTTGGADDLLNKTLTASSLGTGITSFSWDTFIDDIDTFFMTVTFDHASVTNTAAIISKIEIEVEPTNAY